MAGIPEYRMGPNEAQRYRSAHLGERSYRYRSHRNAINEPPRSDNGTFFDHTKPPKKEWWQDPNWQK